MQTYRSGNNMSLLLCHKFRS